MKKESGNQKEKRQDVLFDTNVEVGNDQEWDDSMWDKEVQTEYTRELVVDFFKAVSIDTNLLVVLRATNLLLTPTPSRDHMLVSLPSID